MPLSHSRKNTLKNIGALLSGAAILVMGYSGIVQILRVDGLARYREPSPIPPNTGITIDAFTLRSYDDKNRQIVFAKVDHAKILKDRTLVYLEGVKDGRFETDKGDTIHFETPYAVYGTYSKAISSDRTSHISSKDLDITVPSFNYDDRKKTIYVPGVVKGKLYGGDVVTEQLEVNVLTGSIKTGKIAWHGQVQGDVNGKKFWDIKSDKPVNLENGFLVAEDATAKSTDTIVKGHKIRWDRKKDITTVTGNVQYYSPEANMTCNQAVIYRKESRAILTGNVHMLVKAEDSQTLEEVSLPPLTPFVPDDIAQGRPAAKSGEDQKKTDDEIRDSESLRKYPATLIAGKVDYHYKKGERSAVITEKPQARQELPGGQWRMVWFHNGFYNGETDRLKMMSRANQKDVRMRNSIGDDLRALEAEVSTKKGEDFLNARGIEGIVGVDSDETPDKKGSGATTGGGGGTLPSIGGPIGG